MPNERLNGKLGCEVECLGLVENHDTYHRVSNEIGWVLSSDGSIHGAKYGERGYEFKSKVYMISDKEQMFLDVAKLFATGIRVNSTCGLHVHVSFKDTINYYKLLDWKFVSQFQDLIRTNFTSGIEKKRLVNSYCKFFDGESDFNSISNYQLVDYHKNEHRYRAVNFNAYNLYKTFEFRIFAATNKINKFKSYLNMLLDNIAGYLKTSKLQDKTFEVEEKERDTTQPLIIKEVI